METVAFDGSNIIVGSGGDSQNYRTFREQFTGDTSQTTFQLTGAIENGTFVQGNWAAENINTTLNSHAVNQSGKPIYKSIVLGIGINRINVVSISPTGLVTLNHPPRSEDFDIWYWYKLIEGDVIEDYVREDFVAFMEADKDDIANQLANKFDKTTDTSDDITEGAINKFSKVANIILDSSDSNVTKSFALGKTTFTLTHNLGSESIVHSLYRISDKREVTATFKLLNPNIVEVVFSGMVSDGIYNIVLETN